MKSLHFDQKKYLIQPHLEHCLHQIDSKIMISVTVTSLKGWKASALYKKIFNSTLFGSNQDNDFSHSNSIKGYKASTLYKKGNDFSQGNSLKWMKSLYFVKINI